MSLHLVTLDKTFTFTVVVEAGDPFDAADLARKQVPPTFMTEPVPNFREGDWVVTNAQRVSE